MKPIIGITAAHLDEGSIHGYKTNDTYVQAVVRAGGVPLLLPAGTPVEDCARLAQLLDGFLIPGGEDTAPQYYGEEPVAAVTSVDRRLDDFEMELLRCCTQAKKPVFAICRGCQLLNVAFGGTLYQDIPSQYPGAQGHYQHTDSRSEPYHTVDLVSGSRLAAILGESTLQTNSFHHQSIQKLADRFTVSARTADGGIEGIESADGLLLGVQWHPECMEERFPIFRRLFSAFVKQCER